MKQEIALEIQHRVKGAYIGNVYKENKHGRIYVGRFVGNLTEIKRDVTKVLGTEVKLVKLPFSGWY